ncbi:uncharacterized protein LOC135349112 [Halichondria panicea]|uniref:uncharacterized protein LOC135349112 n=1 Tax=Halichondria panicea TaxID=6063 RepID=UPI00312B9A58
MAMKEDSGDGWSAFSAPTHSEWTRFTGATQRSLLETCFSLVQPSPPPSEESCMCVDPKSWSVLVGSALHPALPLLTSHGPIDERRPPLDLPSDCEGFDWSSESRCQILPTLFKPAKPESPVDISFDHYRAALGLSSLDVEELRTMTEEMRAKFTRLSRTLVEGLEERDCWAGELDVKNRFVGALLRVQSLRVKKAVKDEGKYLHSVLPYHCPEGLLWSNQLLTTLTAILDAIVEDSPKVPSLASDYIQEHILKTPNKDWTNHKH